MRALKVFKLLVCIAFAIQLKAQENNINYFNFHDTAIVNSPQLQNLFHSGNQFQLALTKIAADGHAEHFFYDINPKAYFYPASLVKLPIILLACEKINAMHVDGLTIYSPMLTDSASACQKRVQRDYTSSDSLPSLANYIKRMLLVSDNEAFNRVYEFLGYDYIQQQLSQKGYTDARIIHKLEIACDSLSNRTTNPISFLNAQHQVIYRQSQQASSSHYTFPYGKALAGKAYHDGARLIKTPKDFTIANFLPIMYLQNMLLSVFAPATVDPKSRFDLTPDQVAFIEKYMQLYPYESDFPKYNRKYYPDNFKKYLFIDRKDTLPATLPRYRNVVGRAYGFLSETGFIKTNTESYCFTYVMFCSLNGVINRNAYEYNQVALPIIQRLRKLMHIDSK